MRVFATGPIAIVLLCGVAGAGTANGQDRSLFKPYYFAAYGGVGGATGSVDNVAGLVQFPSTAASDLYETGFALGLQFGARWGPWISEFAIEGRWQLPLTSTGQMLANQSRNDGKKVDIEWVSFALFMGRSFPIGERLAPFVGISNGLGLQQLSAGLGEEPYNDEGYSLAAKAGLDWIVRASSWNLFVRPGVRYQLASVDVGIPQGWALFLGAGIGFNI